MSEEGIITEAPTVKNLNYNLMRKATFICQYEEECAFGYLYRDILSQHEYSLGTVSTNRENFCQKSKKFRSPLYLMLLFEVVF